MTAHRPDDAPSIPFPSRNLAEDNLAAELKRFRLLVENSSDIITVLDAVGTVLFLSPSIERVLGFRPLERIGRNIFRAPIVHPEDVARKQAFLDTARQRPGELVSAEFRLRHADGSWRHIEAVGRNLLDDPDVRGIVASYRDITARREVERELWMREESYRSMFDMAGVGKAMTDPATGRLLRVNRKLCEISGYTAEELLELRLDDLVHPDEQLAAGRKSRLASGAAAHESFEARFVHKDGSTYWVHSTSNRLDDHEGHPWRIATVIHDITARKQAEDALKQAKETAEAANRTKDQFLAMLSHELRTPLTPVLMTASALLEDPDTPEGLRPAFAMIRHNVELEARMIDDLLDLTRIMRGKMNFHLERTDAHDLIERTIENCRSETLRKRLELSLDLAAAVPHVQADPARLQQLIWNLYRNAVKFTPDGGRIRIRTRNAGQRLVVEVEDNGIGVHPNHLDRIFIPFEQGDASVNRRFGGLGLGLAISRSIAEAHGGQLQAASDGPGHGATFWFDIETAVPSRPDPPGAVAPASPSAAQAATILLVEDDATTMKVLTRLLKGVGHDVRAATGIAQALDLITDEIDLVISDIGLPDGNGYELIRLIRGRRILPAIALTGFGMDEDIRKAREAGFTAHLTKPVDFSKLGLLVQKVLASPASRAEDGSSPGAGTPAASRGAS